MFIRGFLSIIFLLLFFPPVVSSKEMSVKIKPISKITTSNAELQEGDNVYFELIEDVLVNNSNVCIKKGTKVTGTVTTIENNDYLYTPAKLYIENFETNSVDGNVVKLSGTVFKAGNDHSEITQFIPLPFVYLRGGEVQIKPKKDTFTLFLEESVK